MAHVFDRIVMPIFKMFAADTAVCCGAPLTAAFHDTIDASNPCISLLWILGRRRERDELVGRRTGTTSVDSFVDQTIFFRPSFQLGATVEAANHTAATVAIESAGSGRHFLHILQIKNCTNPMKYDFTRI